MKPRLLDLFCGAGGAAVGYHRAGFEVVGVDINPQPHYPFEFHQGDAMTWPLDGFDAIHASPPCQFASAASHVWNGRRARPEERHPNLIPQTRARLRATGLPWVIENVPRAERWLLNPLMLCGSMFDTRVYRHRLFECNPAIYFPPMMCNHSFAMPASKGAYHVLDDDHPFITAVGHNFSAESGRRAMLIDWMTRDEMAQAIPPAYTEWIGAQLLRAIESVA
jgi:DNA (cytosine-5)-methyltransferase 1